MNASSASRPESRSSTPQPPRHSRFSSFANSLRQRSRPRTPSSLRGASASGLPQGVSDAQLSNETSEETASRLSLGSLGAGFTSSDTDVSASAVTSSEISSVGAVVSTDDSSVWPSIPVDREHERQQRRNRSFNRQRRDETPSRETGGHRRNSSENDADASSDDDSDAELSANSIEVLGTLLSVATAATAASLVSGNTDPLFSQGPTGAPPNARPDAPPTGSSNPNLGPSPRHPPAANVHNDRARSMWENVRERFSRSRQRRDARASNSDIGEDREEAREQMLREMARAFNLNLSGGGPSAGLEEGSGAATQNEADASNAASRLNDEAAGTGVEAGGSTAPGPGPDGSFERFLHNLQVDLRTALVEDYAARRARARATREQSQQDETSDGLQQPISSTTPSVPEDSSAERAIPTATNGAERWAPTPRTAHLDLPPIPGIDAERSDGTDGPPQAQGMTGQPGAGINWWRLYRFPPMTMGPHTAGNPNVPSATGIPDTVETPVPPPDNTQEPTPTTVETESSDDAGQSAAPGSASNDPQQVVPVIVVGLQSVPVRAQQDENGPPLHPNDNAFPGLNAPMDIPSHERPWPFRAASRALNRMHRGGDGDATPEASTTAPPSENPEQRARQSGRTYLIFVIGGKLDIALTLIIMLIGYYPPNHSIVTGADDMNSFEALWDLAELIGQAKPPVATKDDIEKSGLAVIKASALPDYDKAGKIASNTVEKCVICLDEYEPEDDVRLLSCRHAFHKNCIDKWLETGRNNCPACRSKGVRTGDDPLAYAEASSESPL
ncbi:hypothetical protein BU17DRAFT_49790 [Hysterangium stoloniferum]|nr:hypothetical protein BU17DRAFT_49790 [Hysterangium stoloniferum]